jgi:hypothetical protein
MSPSPPELAAPVNITAASLFCNAEKYKKYWFTSIYITGTD